jgi:hypothetical protein
VATVRQQGNCASQKHKFKTPGNNTAKNKREKEKEMKDIKIFFVFLGLTQKHLMGRSRKM